MESSPRGESERVSVVLCTSGARGSLDDCLASLRALDDRNHEVIVVENRRVASLDADELARAGIRLVHEPRVGLDAARNTGIREASGSIVAFIDDDCVASPHWVSAIREAFVDPEVGFVTGRVIAFSLDRRSERCFERWFSFDRGTVPIRFDRTMSWYWPGLLPGEVGTGANMAYRRDAIIATGMFDEALDMGTWVPGGGDLEMFARLLRGGHVACYAPDAVMHHRHRTTMPAVTRQFFGYGLSQGAVAGKGWRDPSTRLVAIRFFTTYPWRLAAAVRRKLTIRAEPPWWLIAVHLVGVLLGPAAYALSWLRTRVPRVSPGARGLSAAER